MPAVDKSLWCDNIVPMKIKKQYAALPYIVFRDHIEVLLITRRRSKRWIIPKGWPEKQLSAPELAALEAFEEAGLKGRVGKLSIGSFGYIKQLDENNKVMCHVEVYPLKVTAQYLDWPEKGQRKLIWVKLKKASSMIEEKDLARLIRDFRTDKIPTKTKTRVKTQLTDKLRATF